MSIRMDEFPTNDPIPLFLTKNICFPFETNYFPLKSPKLISYLIVYKLVHFVDETKRQFLIQKF